MGLIGKLTKKGVTNVDDEDDDDLAPDDELESVDAEPDTGGLKAGLLGRLHGLRNFKRSNDDSDDDDDMDPKDLVVEEDEVSDAGSGQGAEGDADAEPAEEENPPDVQVVRLEGVPDVRVVGDSSGGAAPSGPQPGNAPSASGGNGVSGVESAPAQGAANAGQPAQNKNETKSEPTGSNEGVGLSLKDIFEEEVEVDEALRDLAESMEDVPAQEIADDLRALFEELEASMRCSSALLVKYTGANLPLTRKLAS